MLYGRDFERSRIGELLDGARQARSGVLVLLGEPGVGKTALLEDAREHASDMLVLSGNGVESEEQLPFAALHKIVRPVLPYLEHLPTPQAAALRGALGLAVGGGNQRFLVSLAVLSLLAEAAETRPLLCLVDDVHWLDDASADALVFVARRLEAEGIVMLFAAREREVRGFGARGLPELHLRGLDPEAASLLLDRHLGGSLSPEARERLIEGTGGNPLGLLALSSTLSEAQLTGAEPLLEPLPVSGRVERSFAGRVRGLPDETQTLLLVAAACESGELGVVLRATEQLGAGAEALDAAEQAELLHVDGERLEFRHPLVRSAVYQAAPLAKRQAAHRALASVLVGGSNADRRAWHRAAATSGPDASVAEELEQVAWRARRRSGVAAASLAFERAAAMTTDEPHRARLLIAAAESAWFAGRPERALMLLGRARPSAEGPIERAEIDRWRGVIELNVGLPADARELLVRAAADIANVDRERALHLLSLAAVAADYSGDGTAIAAIAAIAGRLASEATPVARYLVHFLRGAGSYFSGGFASAALNLRSTLELADEAEAAGSQTFPGLLIFAGEAALLLGDDRAAHNLAQRLVAWARDTGALSLLTQVLPALALSQLAAGQWPSAAAGLNEGLQLARQTDQHQVVAHLLSELALVAALRGDEEECRTLAAESHELATARGLAHVANVSRWALLALELGLARAKEALRQAREISTTATVHWSGLDRIEAAIRAGEDETARAWLGSFEPWAEASGAAWARAAVLHCRALLAADEKETEQLFRAALDAHALAARPFERARSELAFGEFLRRARRRVEAREHLRTALDGFEALRANLWAERTRVELRASGETARKRDPSTTDDLTAQELQIAHFVADGLTNRDVAARLFLSPRTIDFHLRNIFRKLDISSRMQLARLDLDSTTGDPAAVAKPATPPRA